jgi:hypothetical protein
VNKIGGALVLLDREEGMRSILAIACALLAACTGGSDSGTISSSSSGGSSGGASSSGGSSSGGSSGGGSSSGGEPSGVEATCGDADTSVVSGTLGGNPVNVTGATRSWGWVNVGTPAKFDGGFEGGSVHLEWSGSTPNDKVTDLTGATITLTSSSGENSFQSGQLVYASGDTESWLKAKVTFDTGTITVCMRKND